MDGDRILQTIFSATHHNNRFMPNSSLASAAEILRKSNLSNTESRRSILGLFFTKDASALKHSDIEKSLSHIDRVTIYRTLQVFTDKGIIHTIPGTDGSARYALCRSGCDAGHHHDNHVHFLCTCCGETQCLDHVLVPQVPLPDGFEASRQEMMVSGTCIKCRTT
jgi:Fur family ferric uptake transcriptional regulator